MPFADLPDDILLLILDLLVPGNFDEWKQQLSLLSVSQNLRRLALPQAYKHAFITDVLKGFSANIDLIATRGFVSHLHIDLQIASFDSAMLDTISNILTKHLEACSHIAKLKVNMIQPDRFPSLPGRQLHNAVTRAANSVGKLVQILPAINELTLCGGNFDEYSIALQKALTCHYSTQLSKLHYMQCSPFIRNLHLNQITHLSLMLYTRTEDLLPLVCLQTIQYMNISALQPKHTWHLFSRNADNNVKAPYLQELKLNYAGKRDSNTDETAISMMQQHRLHFPRLRILELSGSAKYLPLLNMAVLPDKMDKISILADASAFITFTDVVLPAARSLTCKAFGNIPIDGSQFSSSFNRLLQKSLDCESITVNINDCVTPCLDKLSCPGLTSLELDVRINFDAMKAIIANHPRLIRLWLAISLEKYSDEDESGQLATPLNTSIREVRIDDYTSKNPSYSQTTTLKYLMLRLPSLKRVYGWRVDSSSLHQFASENLPKYPHLANIRFESEAS